MEGSRRVAVAAEDGAGLTAEERKHIDRVARYVGGDVRDGGLLAEKVLKRLLEITRNYRRWGFLLDDHPYHSYYLRQKVHEQCRNKRPPAY